MRTLPIFLPCTYQVFERTTPFPSDATDMRDIGRNVLHLSLKKEGTVFDILTTHLAIAKNPQK